MVQKWPLLIAFVFTFGFAKAQTDASEWRMGFITFADNDTLTATFNYALDNNILQINYGATIKTYTAMQINSFEFVDKNSLTRRRFVSYKYKLAGDLATPTFFEVVTQGQPVSVLIRSYLVVESVPEFDPYIGRTFYVQRTVLKTDVFFKFADENIRLFLRNKKHLFVLLKEHHHLLKKFIECEKLRYSSISDVVKIVEYYNKLDLQ